MIHKCAVIELILLASLMPIGCTRICKPHTSVATSDWVDPDMSANYDARIRDAAIRELEKWVRLNPHDASQIHGAKILEVKREGSLYHVIMFKDNSEYDEQGRVFGEGMHHSYFHVFLDQEMNVLKTERGPDEIS